MPKDKIMFSAPVETIIRSRSSWRSYLEKPLGKDLVEKIQDYLKHIKKGPFGTILRFYLLKDPNIDREQKIKLGTYGTIKGAQYFVIGAYTMAGTAEPDTKNLDFGYAFEKIILFLTDTKLGTCWLGGTFNKRSFSQLAGLTGNQIIAAVTPIGYVAQKRSFKGRVIRWFIKAKHRKPWNELFYLEDFAAPLPAGASKKYAQALEMLRLAPSASNRQPWRVVMRGRNQFHFYLQRSRAYQAQNKLLKACDLQMMDMGIALCHFELTVRELGLNGRWKHADPGLPELPPYTEYCISWLGG
ncbi:MAG: hypothetical protein JW822_05185 [Spirochaetales bacterium]|nr:hypothetical protein [Spirochaetales bacterium]